MRIVRRDVPEATALPSYILDWKLILNWKFKMKNFNLIAVVTLALGAANAYAGDMDVPAGTYENAAAVSQADPSSAQLVTPMKGSTASSGKTRAEVRQELIRAQQDGTMARLNSLLYGGGS
ncbi:MULTISPECIES: DUF4148 domain-containing protein [Paraburkholderia]|jgi:hypothetical protein|uniref:DUF4148 domain-containing protein n=1 Tax=Paraburkholderia TaxID=1822464 RepID=UPI0038B965FD